LIISFICLRLRFDASIFSLFHADAAADAAFIYFHAAIILITTLAFAIAAIDA